MKKRLRERGPDAATRGAEHSAPLAVSGQEWRALFEDHQKWYVAYKRAASREELLEAKRFPSVTTIIDQEIGGFFPTAGKDLAEHNMSPWMRERLEFGQDRGTKAHSACAMLAEETEGNQGNAFIERTQPNREKPLPHVRRLSWGKLDSTLKPYVQAAQDFLASVGARPYDWEKSIVSEALGYGGTYDLFTSVVEGDGRIDALVDYKTGSLHPVHGVQLAAYVRLIRQKRQAQGRIQRWTVYLKPNGRFKIERWTDPDDYKAFEYAVALFQLSKKYRR